MADLCLQAPLAPGTLWLTVTLALQAVLTIPETADPAQPFTEVQQGLSEPYGHRVAGVCFCSSTEHQSGPKGHKKRYGCGEIQPRPLHVQRQGRLLQHPCQ